MQYYNSSIGQSPKTAYHEQQYNNTTSRSNRAKGRYHVNKRYLDNDEDDDDDDDNNNNSNNNYNNNNNNGYYNNINSNTL
jgi:hypothetical protein